MDWLVMQKLFSKKYWLVVVIACSMGVWYLMKHKKNELFPHDISATEDLMREHGLLNRVLLIYEEIINRIDRNDIFPAAQLAQALEIIEKFVENYHEKIEEDHIFPLFEKNNKEVSLVATLREQHIKGRTVTSMLKNLVMREGHDKHAQNTIKDLLHDFITMYRPHEAREDTELFPLVRALAGEQDYAKLAELCEDTEEQIFGEHGFELILQQVEDIEKELGIYALEQFTPRV
jgi:hemerythrin-like domain-containing protein